MKIKYLNDKLDIIGYKGMIHMALLVAKRGEYSNYNLEKRRNIFWTLFYFILKSTLKIKTIVIVYPFIKLIIKTFVLTILNYCVIIKSL